MTRACSLRCAEEVGKEAGFQSVASRSKTSTGAVGIMVRRLKKKSEPAR